MYTNIFIVLFYFIHFVIIFLHKFACRLHHIFEKNYYFFKCFSEKKTLWQRFKKSSCIPENSDINLNTEKNSLEKVYSSHYMYCDCKMH